MAEFKREDITGWVLCGGEGRRMGGLNKGLQTYRGQALVHWVMEALGSQVATLHVNANRDQAAYTTLLNQAHTAGQVWPDEADLQGSLGPLAGILTGLRRVDTPWLMAAACDTPALPPDLVERLYTQAVAHHADIAVPVTTDAHGEARHHWTCALIHARCRASLEAAIPPGERRVGKWVQSCAWIGVSFDEPAAFININTPETLHGHA